MKDKGQVIVFSVIALMLFALLAVTGKGQERPLKAHPGKVEINLPLPPAWQFITQILRPCSSGATPFVKVETEADGDIGLTTCVGRFVNINGSPIAPGGGLGDPGSNGYVVRTSLNVTTARSITVNTPLTVSNGNGVAGNTLLACPTCVFSAASLTNTAIMTGASLQGSQTPVATATLAANGNISTPGSVTTGNAGGVTGAIDLKGATSGTVTTTVKAAAGTWTMTLPDNDGNPGDVLTTDGSGVTSWAAGGGGGFTCGNCANNVLQAGDGAGNLKATPAVLNGNNIGIGTSSADYRLKVIGDTAQVALFNVQDDVGTNIIRVRNDSIFIDSVQLNASGGLSVSATLALSKTITPGGTTGNQTINTISGSVNFAAAATSLTVTNAFVSTSSIITCTVGTNDATLKSVQCVAGSGSFTMFASAAATAETRVNFIVTN